MHDLVSRRLGKRRVTQRQIAPRLQIAVVVRFSLETPSTAGRRRLSSRHRDCWLLRQCSLHYL